MMEYCSEEEISKHRHVLKHGGHTENKLGDRGQSQKTATV